jgi:hypothetical protein
MYYILKHTNFIMSINIFNHNNHTLCEQFYDVVTSVDPEPVSSSGHDTSV